MSNILWYNWYFLLEYRIEYCSVSTFSCKKAPIQTLQSQIPNPSRILNQSWNKTCKQDHILGRRLNLFLQPVYTQIFWEFIFDYLVDYVVHFFVVSWFRHPQCSSYWWRIKISYQSAYFIHPCQICILMIYVDAPQFSKRPSIFVNFSDLSRNTAIDRTV